MSEVEPRQDVNFWMTACQEHSVAVVHRQPFHSHETDKCVYMVCYQHCKLPMLNSAHAEWAALRLPGWRAVVFWTLVSRWWLATSFGEHKLERVAHFQSLHG